MRNYYGSSSNSAKSSFGPSSDKSAATRLRLAGVNPNSVARALAFINADSATFRLGLMTVIVPNFVSTSMVYPFSPILASGHGRVRFPVHRRRPSQYRPYPAAGYESIPSPQLRTPFSSTFQAGARKRNDGSSSRNITARHPAWLIRPTQGFQFVR